MKNEIMTIPQRRDQLSLAQQMTSLGIPFIVVPVTTDEERNETAQLAAERLNKIEGEAET